MTIDAHAVGSAEEPTDLAREFVTLNEDVSSGHSADACRRLVRLAVSSVPGCQWAAVTRWSSREEPRSLASSDHIAATVDAIQYSLAQGPCISAAADSAPFAADLRTDLRWPDFAASTVASTPVRCVMAVNLVDRPQASALNLYARDSTILSGDSVSAAELFAAHTRVLLFHMAATEKSVNLTSALTTSRHIGAAVGILMAARHITEEAAFELLRVTSQHLNRKLADVASDVRQTGELPTAE